jgi:glucosyl-3-phosphoglycerate synthase
MIALMIARGGRRAQVERTGAGGSELDEDRGVDAVRTFPRDAFPLHAVLSGKADRAVSVCIPAHNEASTIARVITAVLPSHVATAGGSGLVDEVLVVDDGSTDGTADVASRAGARVVRLLRRVGKGGAMRAALEAAGGDFLVFLDADVENTTGAFVTSLLGPLFASAGEPARDGAGGPAGDGTGDPAGVGAGDPARDPARDPALVKGYYERPIGDSPTGGGRVTELVAKPLLEVLFPGHPELAEVRQPLAGETAAPRWVLEKVGFAPGYGVEMGLLLDVVSRFGAGAIAQVDLGSRVHRNRSLDELRPQAAEVLRAALDRAPPRGRATSPGIAGPKPAR